MEITRTWTLSTAHISEKTAKWLDSEECDLEGIKYDYGWIIHVPECNFEMPKDLEIIILYARGHDIDNIRLDSDGPIEECLKTYEWDKSDERDERCPIIGLLYEQDGDLSFGHDFKISKEDEDKIWKILSKYETEGASVRGNKDSVVREIQEMYED